MKKFAIYLMITLPLLMLSCSEDNNEPAVQSQFAGGVFVSNEGNFGEGDGSLSFISTDGEVINNLFSASNPGYQLGDVVQSIYRSENLLFAVVNNSNKVEVMDIEDTLQRIYTLENVSLPRSMVSKDGKGYLTEWVSFSDPGRISIFDVESGIIEKSITTDFGAEGVYLVENQLFVTNNFSTTLSIVDVDTEKVTATLTVGNSPAGMVLDNDGDLWVICAGGYDGDFNPLNDGKLVEIDRDALKIKTEVELNANVSGKIAMNPENNTIFYLQGNKILRVETRTDAQPETFTEQTDAISFYGLGIDESGQVYAADAKGFSENGEVFVYSPTGELMNRYGVGRGPNGFVFY